MFDIKNKSPISTFKDLENWFGDRGEEISKSWIKQWGCHGPYLWIKFSDKAPRWLRPEVEGNISYFSYKNLYLEMEDEVSPRDLERELNKIGDKTSNS